VLLLIATRALGVATAKDLADYFRIQVPRVRPRLAELVEEEAILPVAVEGWSAPGFLDPEARLHRRINVRALLSPFDSLIWTRERTERLFGFRYRIGIYTPKTHRTHGYYVLPFLLGDRLVARVDLKSDRKGGALLVQSAHLEDAATTPAVAGSLAEELNRLAGWLELARVRVSAAAPGGLIPALRRNLR